MLSIQIAYKEIWWILNSLKNDALFMHDCKHYHVKYRYCVRSIIISSLVLAYFTCSGNFGPVF